MTGERKKMGIDPYERRWMIVSIALLVAFAATVGIAGFAMGFDLPGRAGGPPDRRHHAAVG